MQTNQQLYLLYEQYNHQYFNNKLPPANEVILAFSSRLTAAAGICYPHKKIIRLSTHYHNRNPQEVGATLLHEMIHLLERKHGKGFRLWIERIHTLGGQVEIHARERATPTVYAWQYRCRKCGYLYPRKKRLPSAGKGYRCGKCKGDLLEVTKQKD